MADQSSALRESSLKSCSSDEYCRDEGPHVVNRRGEKEPVEFDKIQARIRKLCYELSGKVCPIRVSRAVIQGLYNGMRTQELDELAAQTCAYLAAEHYDYGVLASRIAVSNMHKNTVGCFSETLKKLASYVDSSGRDCSLIKPDVAQFVEENRDVLNQQVDYLKDYQYDYFGLRTLEKSYLLRIAGSVVERPQDLLMRVSVGIHYPDINNIIKTYKQLSNRRFTHATPTLFNSALKDGQMSSCFLLQIKEDSVKGIYDTLTQCALISKHAGGIGVAIHKVRSTGTYIRGTNGYSNGIIPMLRVFNDTARYVDQGGGKRKGSFAVYLEPWHPDMLEFLQLRKNSGKEELRARDLFYALWIPDLFMERVEKDLVWSFFDPCLCPGLYLKHGDEFNELYERYESEGLFTHQSRAQELWFAILQSQIETGTPFILYKDACNYKSNHKHLGTIQCSNLCTEVVQHTTEDEVAVCNLASIALNTFVKTSYHADMAQLYQEEIASIKGSPMKAPDSPPTRSTAAKLLPVYGDDEESTDKIRDAVFDGVNYNQLRAMAYDVCINLNNVIDRNYYPIIEAKNSNLRHRPIGIGVQGLADLFMTLRVPYESDCASRINCAIFETLYYGALQASSDLAALHGPYESYEGSPAAAGLLQFDLEDEFLSKYRGKSASGVRFSGLWDWSALKARIRSVGLRNSLLLAPMPTASTSQILGNCESFEPFSSNIYVRRVLSGEFIVINKSLVHELEARGLWSEHVRQKIISDNGSVRLLAELPDSVRRLFKTVWEIKQKALIDLAADRAPFIDQSQSLNIYLGSPSYSQLSSMHFYGYKRGLKTGMYYLRTQPAVQAVKITVDPGLAGTVAVAPPIPNSPETARKAPRNPLASPLKQKVRNSEDSEGNILAYATSGFVPAIEKENGGGQPRVECTDDVCMMCSG